MARGLHQTGPLGVLLLAATAHAAPTPFERFAVVAQARWPHQYLRLSYVPEGCAIRAVMQDSTLHVPLREVRWTLGADNVVTGTCARECMSGTAESHTTGIPHHFWTEHFEAGTFVFRFDAAPARARELVRDLNLFATRYCAIVKQ